MIERNKDVGNSQKMHGMLPKEAYQNWKAAQPARVQRYG
jgi:hypothetical protein